MQDHAENRTIDHVLVEALLVPLKVLAVNVEAGGITAIATEDDEATPTQRFVTA